MCRTAADVCGFYGLLRLRGSKRSDPVEIKSIVMFPYPSAKWYLLTAGTYQLSKIEIILFVWAHKYVNACIGINRE